jgi:prepilin-type N-terminal cleavage/methylation domain-containing protein
MQIARPHQLGFTIVELLVVIVVIGVLAAVTFVTFSGVSRKAVAASLQSDLANAAKQLKLFNVENGYFPATISTDCSTQPDTATNKCLKISPGNSYTTYPYSRPTLQSFILTATNGSLVYRITENSAPGEIAPLTAIAAITGTTEVDSVLAAGVLTPPAATATYQWQRADTSNGTYADIAGATASTYTLVSADTSKYIRVQATGTGSYYNTVTSTATGIVTNPWIAGLAATAMEGKFVRNADLPGYHQYKTTNTAVSSPQGATGLDPSHPGSMSLVNPQTNPSVDFSAYPAHNACKALGGRSPNVQELVAIYGGSASYGNNFAADWYWSATEYDVYSPYMVDFNDGQASYSPSKTYAANVRCVRGNG